MGEQPSAKVSGARDEILRQLLVFGLFCLFSVLVTWPAILTFTTQGLGEHHIDRTQSIWNLWWVKTALLDRHINPYHTDLLFYPQGADLYLHDLSLPAKLIMLGPLLAIGPIGAYNFGMMLALALTGYAGFRLVYFLCRNYAGALVGGLIIGFSPLMQEWVRGHINLLNAEWFILCIEFYLRAWATGWRRDAIFAGLFFALAVLTVGYYEIYLLVFFGLHLAWTLVGRVELAAKARRAAFIVAWSGGTAALLVGPYAWGAWQSLRKGQVILRSQLDVERTVADSADLLSFIVPDRDHWLLGIHSPWWSWVSHTIHEYTTIGPVMLALALLGVWAGRRDRWTWFWVLLGGVGAVLALGPVLQINGQYTIPMPYDVLQHIPPFSAMRAPERYTFLTYIAIAALAGLGISALRAPHRGLSRATEGSRDFARRVPSAYSYSLPLLALILLIFELPFHYRFTEPMPIPESMAALGRDPAPGAVLELPMTQHGWVDTPRMYYQLAHGRPITSGYLSRPIIDPYSQACSPFQMFSAYAHTQARDIVTPTAAGMARQLLADNGIGFIAVYKQVNITPLGLSALPKRQLDALQARARELGTPLADDSTATIYRLRQSEGHAGPYLQLGPDWNQLEESYGQPFRWISGASADFCVYSPLTRTASLTLQAASFGQLRHLQIWVGDRKVVESAVPADGALHVVDTPPLSLAVGSQLVRLVSLESSVSPASLGQGSDERQLSLGFSGVGLKPGGP